MHYREALAQAPDAAYIRKNLARTLMLREKWDEARAHLDTVLAARPGDYAALRLSARALRKLGEFDLALARLECAARLRPGEASIYREMSRIYGEDKQDAAAAQRFLEKAQSVAAEGH